MAVEVELVNWLRRRNSSGRVKVVFGSDSVNIVQGLEYIVLESWYVLVMVESNRKSHLLGSVIDAVGNVGIVVGVEARSGTD